MAEQIDRSVLHDGGVLRSGEEGRLTKEQALLQANAMRSEVGGQTSARGLKLDRESDELVPVSREDYEKAHEVIAELEATINDQVGVRKILHKLGYGTLAAVNMLLGVVGIASNPVYSKTPGENFNSIMDMETLNAAKSKLAEMESRGETWADIRSQYN